MKEVSKNWTEDYQLVLLSLRSLKINKIDYNHLILRHE